MARSSPPSAGGERAGIIAAVRSPLGFFVLVVLVVEAVLGAIALGADGTGRREAMVAMLGVTLLLVAVVAVFAWRKPQALLGGDGAETDAALLQRQRDFARQVGGLWWQHITPVTLNALSWVEIEPADGGLTVRLKGSTYDAQGSRSAQWESSAACATPAERRIFYAWRGWHPAEPGRPYGGYGDFVFGTGDGKGGAPARAVGQLLRVNLAALGDTQQETVLLERANAADQALMRDGDAQAVRRRVVERLASAG
jgi:hypothetical protein